MISLGIMRKAAPIAWRWKKAFTRKRATPGSEYARSTLRFVSSVFCCVGREDPVDELPRDFRGELLVLVEPLKLATDAHDGLGARCHVEIRRLELVDAPEQVVD